MALLNFNAAQVAPSTAMEVLVAGWYAVIMVKSEIKPTTKGDGAYLSAEYEIIAGDAKGRHLFDRFNIQNANPVAQDIGWKTLSAVCHAVNVIQCGDSEQLHGKPLMAKLKVVPATTGADGKPYEAKNEISGYKAYDSAAVAGASAPAGAAPAWASQAASAPAGAPVAFAPASQPAFAPAPAFAPQQPQFAPPAQPQFAPAPAFAPAQAPAPAAAPQWQQPAQPAFAPAQQPAAPNGAAPWQAPANFAPAPAPQQPAQPQAAGQPAWNPPAAAPGGAAPWQR